MFGSGNNEGGFIMGALLGRLLFNQNGFDGNNRWDNQNADRAAIDAAVAAALANANQSNNNSMLLLKDIQDSSQDVVAAVNSSGQQNLIQQLQGQIAAMQGQNNIITHIDSVEDAVNTTAAGVTETITNAATSLQRSITEGQISQLQSTFAIQAAINADGDKTRALITSNEIASLNRQLSDANNKVTELSMEGNSARRARDLEVSVTNNINQNQAQQQQQAQLNQLTNAIAILAGQVNDTKQSVVTIGNNNRPTTSSTANNIG